MLSLLCPRSGRGDTSHQVWARTLQENEVLGPPWPFSSTSQLSCPRPRSLWRGWVTGGRGWVLLSGWVAAASSAGGNCFLSREMGVAELCRVRGASCCSLSRSYMLRRRGSLGTSFQVQCVLISQHHFLPGPLGSPHSSTRCSGSELAPALGCCMTIS